jgi:hypothetical protein
MQRFGGCVGSEITVGRRLRVFRRRESEVLDSLAPSILRHLAGEGLPSRKQEAWIGVEN